MNKTQVFLAPMGDHYRTRMTHTLEVTQIARIMDDMEAEANIETLALAKGIPQCVAVISGDQCSVIVDTTEISEAELAQIVEIVYQQSGITPSGTRVILNTVPEEEEEQA